MKKLLLIIFISLITPPIVSAQWSSPLNISPGTTTVSTNENAGQCIAVSGDTVRVIYTDRSSPVANVMFNQSSDNGLSWGTPQIIYSSPNCSFTAIANSGANVHVVWLDSLGASRASFYRSSYDGGVTWQPVICLDSVTKFWPGIACSGSLVIATLNKDLSGNSEVFIKRSLDNGITWLNEQQISHAVNRSEDPAIAMLGKDVHLSWNDKRSGTMNIYYCHSSDSGATWGTETALSSGDSYTSMVCLDGNHVDVPFGLRVTGDFNIWLAESADTGSVWMNNQQLTFDTTISELYPFMARSNQNLHVVYLGNTGTNYLHSGDGGLSWDSSLFLSPSSQPFIAITGCVLHVIFSNAGSMYYMRNPTGNCLNTSVNENTISDFSFYPNPTETYIKINCNYEKSLSVDIINVLSQTIIKTKNVKLIDVSNLQSGVYFINAIVDGKRVIKKFVKE